tara:strand:- start:175 stop:420 length:246 start_codon:yes stop_codon:yes gene_type:complete
MAKKQKETYTSDAVYTIDDWSMGTTFSADSLDPIDISYDAGQLSFDYEEELRDKYPALKDAWEHYMNVKNMCEAKEKENEN